VCALPAEQPAIRHRILRCFCAPDAVVVPINPIPWPGNCGTNIEDSDNRPCDRRQELGGAVRPRSLRSSHVVNHRRLFDYLREKTDLPLPDFVRQPARSRSWTDASLRRTAAGAIGRSRRSRAVMPVHIGYDLTPKGCMQHPLDPACRRDHRLPAVARVGCSAWRGCAEPAPMFHFTGIQRE